MTDGLERLWIALGDRYALVRELGRGGMALVYLARDLRYDRPVAVKVLRSELAAALGANRFLREIEIAAKLQHPHLLGLLDSGQADGVLFYVMPYVEGESLRDRLERETQLPVDDAVRITVEVADALGYAHSLGVVHRDIKPENILLSGGHAIVADFGIATAITAAGGEKLTQTGIAIGTPSYMSPEQGAGTGKLDGRSDLYALGCVLYEMLAGCPPFTGPTAQSILARHSVDPVPSLRSVRGTVHPGIEWAITKAMAKVRADRFATAAELTAALSHPEQAPVASPRRKKLVGALAATVVGVGVLVALNIGGLRNRLLGRPVAGAIRSLAVLPIRNLTGDTTFVYMADGMTDQFFTDLAQIKALRVIGRTWVMNSRDSTKSVQQIAETLHVDAVLTGSLQRADDSLHISSQLISAATGGVLWAKSYDGVVTNILRLQNEVARDVAERIRIELTPEEHTRLAGPGRAVDPAAYALYVKGRYFWNKRGPENLKRALGFFTQALDVDPTYAAAYAGEAQTYNQMGSGGRSPIDAFPKAKAAASRALELDSSNAEAHAALAYARMYFDWDWPGAERDYRTALTLNPNDAVAHNDYSLFLLAMGRFHEAEAEVQQAVQLDPLSAPIAGQAGWVSHYRDRQDEAVTRLRAAVAMDTANPDNRFRLGRAYQAQGRYQDAMKEYEASAVKSTTIGAMGYVEGALGNREAALRRLGMLDSIERAGSYVSPYVVALVYAGLGENDQVFEWLNKAVDDRTHWIVWLNRDPRWKPWRADPRFKAVGRRVGLPA